MLKFSVIYLDVCPSCGVRLFTCPTCNVLVCNCPNPNSGLTRLHHPRPKKRLIS